MKMGLTARITGWIIALLLFNAVAFLIMLRLPPHLGIFWTVVVGAWVVWWHNRQPGRERLHALVRLRMPRAPRAWIGRAALYTVVTLTGLVGLIHRFGYDLEDDSGAFWEEVTAYQETVSGMLAVIILAVIVIPALEELVFRGRVQRTLERRYGAPHAIVVTSLLFMLAHLGGPHWSVLLVPLVLGLAAGAAVYITQSIWPGILLHAAWNGSTSIAAGAVTALNEQSGLLLVIASLLLMTAGALGWLRLLRTAPRSLTRAGSG